ncbi:MAG: nicotinate-nucleotide adenylyltransferase [Halothiobacillus sp.]|nr:nicotinate-nucleotide adenylyltransferase [Halothiobacillus sp.]
MATSVADTLVDHAKAPLLGILGGTFDPIHLGHLRLAEEVREALNLAVVHFVPSAVPPHRPQPALGPDERLALVRAAIADHPDFIPDGRELERAGFSYTVDTLKSFAAEFPERHLVLILGMDAFNGLLQWHRWQELFDWAHIAVASRPGAVATGEAAALLAERRLRPEQLARQRAGGIVALEITRLDISATAIRAALDAGRSVRYLVPDCLLNPLQAYYSDPDSGSNTH